MRAVIVYESMFGNTHVVAERIGEGLRDTFEVAVVPVGSADEQLAGGVDLLVVGGPTHVHGMTSERTRESAVEQAAKDERLTLDPDAPGPGVRDWLDTLKAGGLAAVFDTRVDASAVLTGRASKGIAKRLRHAGYSVAVPPESFLVDKHNELLEGEQERARQWGAALAAAVAGTSTSGRPT